jgi:hypothetical protein
MVESLGGTTSTRLISPTKSDRRRLSSGLLRCDQKCGGPSMPLPGSVSIRDQIRDQDATGRSDIVGDG